MTQPSTPSRKGTSSHTTPIAPTKRRHTASRIRKKQTGFLELPGEIRNQVYRLSLFKKQPIIIIESFRDVISSSSTNPDAAYHCLVKGPPALLCCHDKVNNEASEIYYQENTFVFQDYTLMPHAVRWFREQMGTLTEKKFTHLAIRRSIQIGDMKKRIPISWSASFNDAKNQIVLLRPPYDRQVFVPGKAKLMSKYVEPCRCEVDAMAKIHRLRRTASGEELFDFVEDYCRRINTEARDVMIDICLRCDTICRS